MKPIFKNCPNKSYKIDGKEIWASRSVAALAIVLILDHDHKIFVLGTKRSQNMPTAPGKWVVPSGYLDWDESGWEALRRELYEESSFLIDDYETRLIYDNNKQPFYVKTEPDEHLQNIALNYCLILGVGSIPIHIESYKNEETEEVKWIPIEKIEDYDWAFEHNKRISMALIKSNIQYL
jgi:8-oxo-dGTP pyrophosphatase MutT (NUDIX family)